MSGFDRPMNCARQVPHRYGRFARRIVDAGSGRADNQVVVAQFAQRLDKVDHLLGSAVKMAPGFDMQYFHCREE
jgi:hypothetical protein